MKVLTPERPPIAFHEIWPEIRLWINLQRGSQNQSRFPLRSDTPTALVKRALDVCVTCYCGNQMFPFRQGRGRRDVAMFVTGFDHKRLSGCPNKVRAWMEWLKLDLGKIEPGSVMVQRSFDDL